MSIMIFSSVETTALDPCCSRAIDCENALRRSPVRRDKFGLLPPPLQRIRRRVDGLRHLFEVALREQRGYGPFLLETFEARLGVAELVELHSHSIHDREEQAAHLSVFVAGVYVVQRATRLERAAEPAG